MDAMDGQEFDTAAAAPKSKKPAKTNTVKKKAKPAKKKAVKKTAAKPKKAKPVEAGFVRLDFRISKSLKNKLNAKAKSTRRTITSILQELLEKMR
jgi:hypothetical protein